jgi:hypothetical protein
MVLKLFCSFFDPNSALSQISCQSPTMTVGGEEKGGFVRTVICEKPPALASLAMAADKHQKVAALCQSLGFTNICETPLVRRRVLSFK